MVQKTDHSLRKGDHLNLTNESEKPMVVEVAMLDGASFTATLPLGGSVKFVIGEQEAEIKVRDLEDAKPNS